MSAPVTNPAADGLLAYLQQLSSDGSGSISRGRLTPKSTRHTAAADAMTAFLAFHGEGWLHTAESADIRLLPAVLEGALKTKIAAEWPIAGERYSQTEDASLHLRRADNVWIVATLRREPDADAVLSESRLLAERRHWPREETNRWLRYEVSHEPSRPNDPPVAGPLIGIQPLRELRPTNFRFVGFLPPLDFRPAQR